jgi:hypothetical protein
MKEFFLKSMLLMICGAWCCVATFAQNINPLFMDIDESKCYRIVNVEKGDGGVGIGALHNSDIVVKYVDATEQNTDDCYWFIECHEQTIRFRNKSTGQYLTYTPEKDYETFINLKLLPTPSEESEWHILAREGFLTFYHQADEKYYMGIEQAKNMVKASSGMPDHASKYFFMVDEQGKALKVPAITPFSAYINHFALDGQRPIFENRKSQFMYPLPTPYLEGGDYAPQVSFQAADDAHYELITESKDKLVFDDAATANGFVMHLMRDGVKVAEAPIVFSPLPLVEITTILPDDKEKEYRNGTLHVLNQTTTDSIGVEQELPAFFRYRGATTLNYPKRSFNIKLRDDLGEDLDTTFFNIRSKDKWILDAMSIDQINMRNRVCFDIWNAYSKTPYSTEFGGRNGTQGQFVEVILNGSYNGIYCFTDRIDRKLLDLKKYKEDMEGNVTIRGLLYKSNLWDNTGLTNTQLNPDANIDSVEWNNWELQYPDDFPGQDTWEPLRRLYDVCSGDELMNNSVAYFYENNVIDFHLLVMALNLIDNGNKNIFLSNKNITKNEPFVFTPWDMDTSLGGYYDGRYSGGTYDETKVSDLRIHKNEPFATLWNHNVAQYRDKLAARWNEVKKSSLSVDAVQAQLQHYANIFTKCGAWQREYTRWQKEEKYGCPTVENLKNEINLIVAWYQSRLKQVDQFIQENTTTAIKPLYTPQNNNTPVYLLNGAQAPNQGNGIVGIYIKDGKKYMKVQ